MLFILYERMEQRMSYYGKKAQPRSANNNKSTVAELRKGKYIADRKHRNKYLDDYIRDDYLKEDYTHNDYIKEDYLTSAQPSGRDIDTIPTDRLVDYTYTEIRTDYNKATQEFASERQYRYRTTRNKKDTIRNEYNLKSRNNTQLYDHSGNKSSGNNASGYIGSAKEISDALTPEMLKAKHYSAQKNQTQENQTLENKTPGMTSQGRTSLGRLAQGLPSQGRSASSASSFAAQTAASNYYSSSAALNSNAVPPSFAPYRIEDEFIEEEETEEEVPQTEENEENTDSNYKEISENNDSRENKPKKKSKITKPAGILFGILVLGGVLFGAVIGTGLFKSKPVSNPGDWPSDLVQQAEEDDKRNKEEDIKKEAEEKSNTDPSSTPEPTISGDKTTSKVPSPNVPDNKNAYSVADFSFTNNPAGQSGTAVTIKLTQAELVSKIELNTAATGGHLQVYANSDANNPKNGSPLADFELSPDSKNVTTVVLARPTRTQNLVIWVPQSDFPKGNFFINSLKVY